ncbi:MAG: ubiquitin-conjugating enzyme E2 [Chloroflexaceae bacterium]|nr:ubiquitin-conjugating enzyme E2 [Chloroflexaceae bacterium]
MGVREDRLQSEYEAMQKFRSDVVTWETIGRGHPPDHYRISYHLRSFQSFDAQGNPQIVEQVWKVDIKMPPNYPWGKPEASFVGTPVYHPNVWKIGDICIEDQYEAGIGIPLDVLCEHIGKIIAYQEYNLGSPANDDDQLVDWITHFGESMLPTDPRNIRKAQISFGELSRTTEPPRPKIKFGP